MELLSPPLFSVQAGDLSKYYPPDLLLFPYC
jgi:hypothetical protein